MVSSIKRFSIHAGMVNNITKSASTRMSRLLPQFKYNQFDLFCFQTLVDLLEEGISQWQPLNTEIFSEIMVKTL